jgi:hypothetical protein
VEAAFVRLKRRTKAGWQKLPNQVRIFGIDDVVQAAPAGGSSVAAGPAGGWLLGWRLRLRANSHTSRELMERLCEGEGCGEFAVAQVLA